MVMMILFCSVQEAGYIFTAVVILIFNFIVPPFSYSTTTITSCTYADFVYLMTSSTRAEAMSECLRPFDLFENLFGSMPGCVFEYLVHEAITTLS